MTAISKLVERFAEIITSVEGGAAPGADAYIWYCGDDDCNCEHLTVRAWLRTVPNPYMAGETNLDGTRWDKGSWHCDEHNDVVAEYNELKALMFERYPQLAQRVNWKEG